MKLLLMKYWGGIKKNENAFIEYVEINNKRFFHLLFWILVAMIISSIEASNIMKLIFSIITFGFSILVKGFFFDLYLSLIEDFGLRKIFYTYLIIVFASIIYFLGISKFNLKKFINEN